jgi:hypothetical protein
VAVVSMTVVLAGSASVSVASGQPTHVTNCDHTSIRPRMIMFACADGGFYVDHLRWGFWGKLHARGRGVFHENDCTPDCARGHFHSRRGHITLRDRKWCSNVKQWVFKRMTIRFRRPLLGRSVVRGTLPCPF